MKRLKTVLLYVTVLMLTGGVLHLGARGADGAEAKKPKGTYKVAMHWTMSAEWSHPSLLASGTSSIFIPYLAHDALTKPMPGDMYAPCLAESWTMSEDAKVWEFKLRKGVKFQNGDDFTADDVVFTFQNAKGSNAKFFKEIVEKLEAVDPHLFRVTFKRPLPDFLDYTLPAIGTIAWVVPKKYLEKVGDEAFKTKPIGAGPYKIIEFEPGMKVIAEAFEGFWRKVPNVKRIEVYTIEERATRYAMVKKGEVDNSTLMSETYYQKVKEDKELRLFDSKSPSHRMFFPTQQYDDPKSPWANPKVRKAVSLAIDRKPLAEIYAPGGGRPIGQLGLDDDPMTVKFPPDPYNPELAKKMLAEAGYPNGFDGGNFYPQNAAYGPLDEMTANFLLKLGIKLNTVIYDRATYYSKRRSTQFKGHVFTESAGTPTVGTRYQYVYGDLLLLAQGEVAFSSLITPPDPLLTQDGER